MDHPLDPVIRQQQVTSAGPTRGPRRAARRSESDSVPERPDACSFRTTPSCQGSTSLQQGDHRVVWWDPKTLNLHVEESVGQRQQKLLEADKSSVTSDASARAHATWQVTRARVRATAGIPSIRVQTVTERASSDVASADVILEESRDRAGAAAWTTVWDANHAVLATVDLGAIAAEVLETAVVARARDRRHRRGGDCS
jgi:hypothetical protein